MAAPARMCHPDGPSVSESVDVQLIISTPSATTPTAGFLTGLVTLTFLMNAIGRGVTETFAVYLLPVEAALGVDRGQISATYSIYMLAYGCSAPFVGQLMDKFGARLCYATGLLALGLGTLLGARSETDARCQRPHPGGAGCQDLCWRIGRRHFRNTVHGARIGCRHRQLGFRPTPHRHGQLRPILRNGCHQLRHRTRQLLACSKPPSRTRAGTDF